ncbi:MAG: rRNA biogenesis protein [Euryarchaeota archaeon]|nr:rRNA biogenesis protein [Euryarchaeota archaeon]MCG2737279.1 rRNA biogenesis protein [Candidatus Methanoperedenaceae archaeon]
MQIKTWFGIFTLDKDRITGIELFQKDIEAILDRVLAEPLLLRGKIAGEDLRDLAVKHGFITSREEYDTLLHELNIRLAKKQVENSVTPDRQIIAAVEAIDDIDETGNILAERLREWYMLNFDETNLKGRELAIYIAGMKEPGSEPMKSLASSLLGLYESRLSIEEYLKKSMQKTVPNLTGVAGYLLGARLLSIAGSLEKLASMPSSTVQVIGASNALFKHLRGKASSPKHGVIFRHPYVNTAPKRLRGKIARAVAAKISLAARYDMYSGKINENLPVELDKKVMNIRKRAKK